MPHLRTPTAPGQALARLKAALLSGFVQTCGTGGFVQRLRSAMRDRRRVPSDRRRRHRHRRAQQAAHAKQGPSHKGSQTSQTSQQDPSARRHGGGRLRWRVRVRSRGGFRVSAWLSHTRQRPASPPTRHRQLGAGTAP